MNEKVPLLKAEIKRQLEKMAHSHRELAEFVHKLGADQLPDNYQKAAIGYYLHNFYNGCENIFSLIARTFENNIGGDQWHRDLLYRMTLEIQSVRPAVIDEELCGILDNFRSFRHVFRHCYSFELDWAREKIVFDQREEAWRRFETAMKSFLKKLDRIGRSIH
jgi:hypothetical protein